MAPSLVLNLQRISRFLHNTQPKWQSGTVKNVSLADNYVHVRTNSLSLVVAMFAGGGKAWMNPDEKIDRHEKAYALHKDVYN